MSANFALFNVGGNVAKEPMVYDFDNGGKMTIIRLAINKPNSYRKDFVGPKASYIDVKFFGHSAETAAKYFTKGRAIVAWGHITDRTYTDRNGEQKTKTEFIAESYEYNDNKNPLNAERAAAEASSNSEAAEEVVDDVLQGIETKEY